MSPTINSPVYDTEDSPLVVLSIRKNSSDNNNRARYNSTTSLTSASYNEANGEGQFESPHVKPRLRNKAASRLQPVDSYRQNEVDNNHTATTIPRLLTTASSSSSSSRAFSSVSFTPTFINNRELTRHDSTYPQSLNQNVKNGETLKNLNINGVKNGESSKTLNIKGVNNGETSTTLNINSVKNEETVKTLNITGVKKNGESLKTVNINGVKKEHTNMTISEVESFNDLEGRSRKRKDHVFLTEPCLYSHKMFLGAAKIFEFLIQGHGGEDADGVQEKHGGDVVGAGDIPEINFDSPQEQMKTFELTFATLKFQKLFSGILNQTGFFTDYPDLLDEYSLVCIILFDMQARKFQKRKPFPNEQEDGLCCQIEEALLAKKTRLQSHVAKERIKHCAPTIEHLIPEQSRKKDETQTRTPVYLWVNHSKTTMDNITAELETHDFTRLEPGEDISEQTGNVFQVDAHCSDLVIFPPHLDMYFKDTDWVKMGHLVQQDKSSCLGPQTVQHLLGIDQDVIHVNVGTGVTTAHLASLLRENSANSHIWGYCLDTPEKAKKATKNLEFLGAKNTKILSDNFLNVDPDEPKLRSVRVILVTANCSKSAIASPVQFIVSEGEDMRFLGELSKDDQGMSSVANLMVEHEKLLRHALKFPRVQAVVYVTRSKHEAENELVVTRVLEYVNSSHHKGAPFTVTPPVLPFTNDEIDSGSGGVDDRFIRFQPSDKSNGCFVAVISREPDDPKDVARNVIARAKSGGLLGKTRSGKKTLGSAKSEDQGVSSAGFRRSRKSKTPTPKHSGHRASTSIGVRLYKAGMAQIVEQQAKVVDAKPEHVKIVKHPAPFR